MNTLRAFLRKLLNLVFSFYPTTEERTKEDSHGN